MPENTPETRPAGAVKTLVVEDVPFSFRWAPPGTFTMGSPETEPDRQCNEILRDVTFESGFWILATPVTQRQFMLTKKRNPAAFARPEVFAAASSTSTRASFPSTTSRGTPPRFIAASCRRNFAKLKNRFTSTYPRNRNGSTPAAPERRRPSFGAILGAPTRRIVATTSSIFRGCTTRSTA